MQREYIIEKPGNRRLLIFFTGWSTDFRFISNITLSRGYDFICCWDYRKISWDTLHKQYEEAIVIAWSFGVYVAELLLPTISKEIPVTGSFAINGSVFPVDDEKGIPVKIFQGTLNTLDERNLRKFRIRISGGLENFKCRNSFLMTNLNIEQLIEELKVFVPSSPSSSQRWQWDFAFISENDKIFPPSNLIKAWADTPHLIIQDSEHADDFQKIFNLVIKDKDNIGFNFERSFNTYNDQAKVQNYMARMLLDYLKKTGNSYKKILEIGCGAGNLTHLIKKELFPDVLTLVDLAPKSPLENEEYVSGDAELLINDFSSDTYDLIVAGSTIQWFHSPFRFLKGVKRVLKSKGVCALTTYLSGNFKELTDLTGNSLLYLTDSQWKGIAKNAGFRIMREEVVKIELEFSEVKDILSHLKLTGVNSLTANLKTIGELKNIIKSYPKTGDKYKLTYLSYIMLLQKNG
ncbi:MAG: DUF452 family protein [Muribaculaceae bacterium]|nr:DUF452 family protein [Muribaculaceae bacterium]